MIPDAALVLDRLKPYARNADDALLAALADVEPPVLREAVEHYPRAGGKRLRPVVAMLAAEAAGGSAEDGIPAAVAAELIHDFSLVHDDIMDKDELRRGEPTVHAKWGEAVGILAGDALLAKAFEVLARAGADSTAAREVLLDASRTTAALCEGQALDMAFEDRDDVTVEEYTRMIGGKTAALYEFAARAGARLGLPAGAPIARVEALATWGREFGLAFQVRDDVLDVVQSTEALGKTAGKDVRNGKKTILLIEARRRAVGPHATTLARVVGRADASDPDVAAVVDAYRASGALAEAERVTRAHADAAVAALKALDESPARGLLADVANWGATRSA